MAAVQLEEGEQPSPGHPGCRSPGRLEMPAGDWGSPMLAAGDGAVLAGASVEERALLSRLGAPPWSSPSSLPLPGPAGSKPRSSAGAAAERGSYWFPSWCGA